jgi:hypothetical protein
MACAANGVRNWFYRESEMQRGRSKKIKKNKVKAAALAAKRAETKASARAVRSDEYNAEDDKSGLWRADCFRSLFRLTVCCLWHFL